MNPGKLNRRVELQRATYGESDAGQQTIDSWDTYATRWAAIKAIMGREPELAEALNGRLFYEVKLRYYPDVTHGDRVIWKTNTLHIGGITHDDANKWTILACIEVEE